jgi:CubicO group peptidase (beta-lactamase class C family)
MPKSDPLQEVADWPVDTAGAMVVSPAGTVAWFGTDVEFPWASVTKLMTALTVLDAVEQGLVDFDEAAGPAGSTVAHLLAHASGLAPDEDRVLARPGRRRIYSNRGFEVLAALVADRAGRPFPELLRARVCEPLGMTATRLDGSPAHGAVGPVRDLGLLAQELLAPTLLPQEVMARACSPAFPGLSGVLPGFGRQDPNDWGLGFEIRDNKRPHWTGSNNSPVTFGHFGQAGGFLWVDPVARLACACLTDRAFGEWALKVWPALSDGVLARYAAS